MFRSTLLGASAIAAAAKVWYEGLDNVMVFDASESAAVKWWDLYQSKRRAQFTDDRLAVLLTSGAHDIEVGLGYYMSLYGVGKSRKDVKIKSFYALDFNDDGADGGATMNFWRSVEGVTASNPSLTWATSQACPIRRSHVRGELHLSVQGEGTHYSSGGFLGDTQVDGPLRCGSQQQFFFRNDAFGSGTDCGGLLNGAFVGSEGQSPSPHVTEVAETPNVAEKPFLIEDDGSWFLAVPHRRKDSHGLSNDADVDLISFSAVHVAKPSDDAAAINKGIRGKRALLLTPGVYDLHDSIRVTESEFVVLGIGFATLVAKTTAPALIVEKNAEAARIAGVLFEAGVADIELKTEALLEWRGMHGIGSDIFTRVGAFPGRDCAATRADVHVRLVGKGTVLDNTWMWHADHDECDGRSDVSVDKHGLLVDGDDIIAYGLKAEHMLDNHVHWNGQNGRTYFYQCELPYNAPDFGPSGKVGYHVAHSVLHEGWALGVYIIFDQLQHATAFRAPPSAHFHNLLAWSITGSAGQFEHLLCIGDDCISGECSFNQCRLDETSNSWLV
jgi:hypothetical protein